MTYYGRWTYKYEIASAMGAAAALIVHETGPAGYPWEVVRGSWGRENFDIAGGDLGPPRVPVEAWITREAAERLLAAAGRDLENLRREALTPEFRPIELDARADFELELERRQVLSRNVLAAIPGEGPRADEWIVYSAHWDHLGVDESIEGDGIFNGALDNASGTAGLIELAEALAALPRPPERSFLLLAVTAEEKGLLGSKHYAAHPLVPLGRTLANVNMDGLNPWGRTLDVESVSAGQTTLEELLAEEAARQGRRVEPHSEPEKGTFYRSDHFEFAKRGVPALYAESGVDYLGRPAGWGRERRNEYTARDYHKPSDEVKPSWDLSGAVEDLRLYFRIGLRLAETDPWPEWYPGTEFREVRRATLAEQAPRAP
jgi:Zn-dependent M28 family amino/carboxypeptidase